MTMNADTCKVEAAVKSLLQATIDAGKQICFFDINAMMASLKLSRLPKSKYHDLISDMLTGQDMHRQFGDWITCEYECNVRVLVQLAKAGERQSVCDEEKNHFAMFTENCQRKLRNSFPVKKQKIAVPKGVSVEDATRALDSLVERKDKTRISVVAAQMQHPM